MRMVVREARRFIRTSPLLGLSGVLILALGISASALTFALIVALSSPVYPGMKLISYATIAEDNEDGASGRITWTRFEELRTASRSALALAAYSQSVDAQISMRGISSPLKLAAVSSGFFNHFTSTMLVGRDFTRSEEGQSGLHAVVLSFKLAITLFQSPANAQEQLISLNGTRYEVVGVTDRDFSGLFGEKVDAWIPASQMLQFLDTATSSEASTDTWKRASLFYSVAASDRLPTDTLADDLVRSMPLQASTILPLQVSSGLTIDPGRDLKVRRWLRLGLVLALLLTTVSSLNYALLLFARMPRYAEEVRLKKALGASTSRLIAELMVGPATILGASLLTSVLFCLSSLSLLSKLPGSYGQIVQGSGRTILVAMSMGGGVACTLTLFVSTLPAISVFRNDITPRMGYTSTANRHALLWLQIPVILQIAFCAGVWILTGMIVSSLTSLMRIPLGYNPQNLTVVCIQQTASSISSSSDPSDPNHSSFPAAPAIRGLIEMVSALPGVVRVSYAGNAPLDDQQMSTLTVQRIDSVSDRQRVASLTWVSPGYFKTMETLIISGRDLSPGPEAGVREIIINESLANALWPNQNPVNKTVRLTYPSVSGLPSSTQLMMVVGVASDVRHLGLTESPEPTVYFSAYGSSFFDSGPRLIISSKGSVGALRKAISQQVRSLMPGLDVVSLYQLQERTRASLRPEVDRVYFSLLGAITMAVLSSIGLYGSLSYYVSTRRRDVAVRICFGATSAHIRNIIILRSLGCACIAVSASLPLWFLLARFFASSYLGRVSWSTGQAVIISFVCIIASGFIALGPARAAARISPSEMLKE